MNIFLLDDELEVRRRLCALIEELPDMKIEEHASEAGDMAFSIRKSRPDVLVMDIHTAGSLELIRRLKAESGSPVVMVLSNEPSLLYRVKSHEAGAAYFFDKTREQERLIEAIEDLAKELA